ncbi:hypothetical protein ACB098_07G024300 [Castanea mollissima]
MQYKKEICRNFQRGSCRFGESCRYIHGTQQQQHQQQPKSVVFGSNQQQNSNPFGFGVQNTSQSRGGTDFASKQNQPKPFQNTWTRSTSTTPSGALRQSDNPPQSANHKCTDPETCKRQIAEDFNNERPLWKLTCYAHSRNLPSEIVGDISYEELRAAAYDDNRRGVSLQSIVERERNLVNSKIVEFDNFLRKPNAVPPNSTLASQSPFSGARPNAFPGTAQNSAPPLVTSFSQLGASQIGGLGIMPSMPSNSAFAQPNAFPNSSQTSSAFGTNNFPYKSEGAFSFQNPTQTPGSSITSNTAGFSNGGNIIGGSNSFFPPAAPAQVSISTSNNSPILTNGPNFSTGGPAITNVQLGNNLQMENASGESSIWLKEKWNPGEIPEEAPPDGFVW